MIENIKKNISELLKDKNLKEQVSIINELREHIHTYSPFKNEPVDFVKWVPCENVVANEYNPNKVAPPEMKLLEISIENDGFTQPIVTFPNERGIEVVDGFHRNRVGKESLIVRKRIKGFLPTVKIKSEQSDKNNRIASTIRHNRARGKHIVDAMSEIVLELKNRNWKNERIARELGMDEDEILRLCQITGLEDIFKDDDFSKAWNVEDSYVDDFEPLTDEVTEKERQQFIFKTVNTSDPNRKFHIFDKWECHKAGFYSTTPPDGMTKKDCELKYAEFLSDDDRFKEALEHVISEWKYSCEHYLTNKAMNRIAWLGQASLCYATGISSKFRSGFHNLSPEQQDRANRIAYEYLLKWLNANGYKEISFEEAMQIDRQTEIY